MLLKLKMGGVLDIMKCAFPCSKTSTKESGLSSYSTKESGLSSIFYALYMEGLIKLLSVLRLFENSFDCDKICEHIA